MICALLKRFLFFTSSASSWSEEVEMAKELNSGMLETVPEGNENINDDDDDRAHFELNQDGHRAAGPAGPSSA